MLRVLIAVVVVFCGHRVHAQCRNGVCYAPSLASPGRVIRRWRIEADGTRTLIYDATKSNTKNEQPTSDSTALMPGEINRDPVAFAHAKREAELLAAGMWNNSRRVGHPLGTAPGCRFSGTGQSVNGTPNHCYRYVGDHRVVARACVRRNGRYWWSAHYR